MTEDEKIDAFRFFGRMAQTYGEQYPLGDSPNSYSPNWFRLQIALGLLKSIEPKRILDVGCGSGEPLIAFLKQGFKAVGFDRAGEMVAEARHNLVEAGYSAALAQENNMEEVRGIQPGEFDCIVALGSVYYARDFPKTMANLSGLLPAGGHFIFSLRNELFSLFSVNKYTVAFFLQHFLPLEELSEETRGVVMEFLSRRFMEENVGRSFRTADELKIHSIYHNPLTVQHDVLDPCELVLKGVYFYHYHALPPIFEHICTDEFRRLSARMERPTDWRGLFLASTFVVHAQKIA